MRNRFQATKQSAFLAGFSLSAAASALDIAHAKGLITFTADSPGVFPFLAAYFLASGAVFVIGLPMISMSSYERIPYTTIPKNGDGWIKMIETWGRMVIWFVGGATVILIMSGLKAVNFI